MKRILLYPTTAVVLGILLTLIPAITLAEIKPKKDYGLPSNVFPQWSEGFENLEKVYDSRAQEYSVGDFRIFVFSFVVALIVYVLFKHKTTHREYRLVGHVPY